MAILKTTTMGTLVARDSPSQLPGLPGYDPQNVQPWLVRVIASMTVLAVVSVSMRLFSRRIRQQPLWWDDGMIIFSMLWNLVVVGFVAAMYSAGMGVHVDKAGVTQAVRMARWLLVAEILYAWNLGWTKLALLLMYYRIFRVPYFKRMAWLVGGFVMAWVLTITFIFIFICVPVQKLWYPDLPGRCINQVATWIANAASTILTDLTILLMPIPQIWRLQLRRSEKAGLTFAFGLGFFVVFASAYRTSVLFTYSNSDPTYTLAPTVGWTVIEMSAGIVSACLPTMLPVFNLVAECIGFKRSFLSLKRGASSAPSAASASQSAVGGGSKGGGCGGSSMPTVSALKDQVHGSNAFYRLDDVTESEASLEGAVPDDGQDRRKLARGVDAGLRPDTKGLRHTVRTQSHQTDHDASTDDIPLHGIRVKTEFQQTCQQR